MTAEHLTLLQPSDLRSVRIVCNKCRGSVSIHLNETVKVPIDCPICKEPWKEPRSLGATDVAESLGNAVKKWIATEKEKTPPFSMHFEIVNLP